MATIAELTGHTKRTTNKRTAPVKKERAFHFRRVQPGYYISNRKHSNGQHIVMEKIHDGWLLRYVEGRQISKHGSRKACLFALAHGLED